MVHICEKGPASDFGHCPNVTYTYEQIKDGFAGYEVLVVPEFEGNLNWTKTSEWIKGNFSGVPIIVNVFEGGNESLPKPNVMMSLEELEQVMEIADVEGIRFAELISWYMNQTYPNVSIPTVWVHQLFDLAIDNNLRIIWSDWKLGYDVEEWTNSTLSGYEDKITYVYQTNNEFQHPVIGFLYAMQFPNWGASVQSWYWQAIGCGKETEMPVYLIVEHSLISRNMEAQIIMFEPYWYFFDDNGTARYAMYSIWETI